MQIQQVNKILKESLMQLVNNGYAKSIIGKILLGSSGAAAVMHGFNSDDGFSFGIKPLTRIGKLMQKEVHIVFIDADGDKDLKLLQDIDKVNNEFINQLSQQITEYMQTVEDKREELSHAKNTKNQQQKIDTLLQFLE